MTLEEIISCIDLTSLNEADTSASIQQLCQKAATPLGQVAAICCYSLFLQTARAYSPKGILLATVVNFPAGDADLSTVCTETKSALANGANEIDLVIPYKSVLSGDLSPSIEMVEAVKEICVSKTIKVIIESGVLNDTSLISRLSLELLWHGADFIKTSTGKVEIGATEAAAEAILKALKQYEHKTGIQKGLKVSGGIKTVRTAKLYMNLAEEYFGETYLKPATFRIGASSLLDEVLSLQKN